MTRQTEQLERFFPALTDRQLVDFLSTDWCEMLTEQGTTFASRPDLGTCTLGKNARSFTVEAHREYQRIHSLLESSGLRIEQVTVRYADNKIATADFVLAGPWVHWSYDYDARGTGVIDPPNDRAIVVTDEWTFWRDGPD
jgi:hypothetical protein